MDADEARDDLTDGPRALLAEHDAAVLRAPAVEAEKIPILREDHPPFSVRMCQLNRVRLAE